MLADGSEYRGRYGLGVRELERFHRPRVAALAAAGPDALALETVPDVDEAEALVRVAEETGVPYWLSYSVAGGRTRAGQPLEEAFAVAAGRDGVLAVGVNCCDPEEAQEAVELAVAVTGRPAVVYPNSGRDGTPGAAMDRARHVRPGPGAGLGPCRGAARRGLLPGGAGAGGRAGRATGGVGGRGARGVRQRRVRRKCLVGAGGDDHTRTGVPDHRYDRHP